MKRFFTVALVLAMMLITSFAVIACSDGGSSSGGAITVTDQMGRSVTIDAPAERIISGYYISSSACIALGLEDKLVGVEMGMTSRPIYQLATELSYDKVANVGRATEFDIEAAIAKDPDLVILPYQARTNVDAFEELNIPVVVVSPEDHEKLVGMIQLIAKLTGTEQKANSLISYYNTKIAMIEELTKDIAEEDKKTVYMASPSAFLSTAPKDMYQSSIIRSAGGKNAGDSLQGNSWAGIDYEKIIVMSPDIIIIPTNNNANGQPTAYSAATIAADEALTEVPAVIDGAIYNMPHGLEAWDSPVPSGILGMLWILNVLHPDLYTMAEFVADATDFYKTFYGFDLNSSLITGVVPN